MSREVAPSRLPIDKKLRSLRAVFFGLTLLAPLPASAGTTWDGGGANASWGTAGNWGGALPAFDGTSSITIGSGFTSGSTLTLDGTRYINDLTIATKSAFTIAAGTGGTLNLRSGNITRQDISGNPPEPTHTISAGIVLGDPAGVAAYAGTFNIAGSNGLDITGNISEAGGSRGINLTGSSWLRLSGTNSFSGGITVTSGQLIVSSDSNLGASSGGITLNGGTIDCQGSFTSGRAINLTSTGGGIEVDAGYTVELTGVMSGNATFLGGYYGGTLILSGSGSNGTGVTQIWGSVVSYRGSVGIGTGILEMASNGIVELGNSNLTRPLGNSAGQVWMNVSGSSGFAAWGADRIVNLGGAGATVTWNSGAFILSGYSLLLGSSTGNATLDFQNGIDLGTLNRTVQVAHGTGTGADGKLSGTIIGSGGGLIVAKNGTAGRLLLSNGNNSYSGSTTVQSGELWLSANATSGVGNTVLGSGSSAVQLGIITGADDAALKTAAAVTVGRNISVVTGNTGAMSLGGVTANASTFSGSITLGSTTSAGHSLTLTAATGGTVTISGVIADFAGITGAKGTITKTGSGAVALTNANTYAGGTTVSAGYLFANNTTGSGTGTGSITVNNSGSTFGGSGIVSGAVSVASAANVSPGATGVGSTAILRTGALTLNSGSNFNVDLNSTTVGSGYDQINVTGVVSISGSNIIVTAGSGLTTGQKFFVLLNDGSDLISGNFAQNASVTASNGDIFTINYLDNGDSGGVANDISLTFTATVPEPATYAAGILSLAIVVWHQRRRWTFSLRR
jgi:autotransporter-associated beta strand protein